MIVLNNVLNDVLNDVLSVVNKLPNRSIREIFMGLDSNELKFVINYNKKLYNIGYPIFLKKNNEEHEEHEENDTYYQSGGSCIFKKFLNNYSGECWHNSILSILLLSDKINDQTLNTLLDIDELLINGKDRSIYNPYIFKSENEKKASINEIKEYFNLISEKIIALKPDILTLKSTHSTNISNISNTNTTGLSKNTLNIRSKKPKILRQESEAKGKESAYYFLKNIIGVVHTCDLEFHGANIDDIILSYYFYNQYLLKDKYITIFIIFNFNLFLKYKNTIFIDYYKNYIKENLVGINIFIEGHALSIYKCDNKYYLFNDSTITSKIISGSNKKIPEINIENIENDVNDETNKYIGTSQISEIENFDEILDAYLANKNLYVCFTNDKFNSINIGDNSCLLTYTYVDGNYKKMYREGSLITSMIFCTYKNDNNDLSDYYLNVLDNYIIYSMGNKNLNEYFIKMEVLFNTYINSLKGSLKEEQSLYSYNVNMTNTESENIIILLKQFFSSNIPDLTINYINELIHLLVSFNNNFNDDIKNAINIIINSNIDISRKCIYISIFFKYDLNNDNILYFFNLLKTFNKLNAPEIEQLNINYNDDLINNIVLLILEFKNTLKSVNISNNLINVYIEYFCKYLYKLINNDNIILLYKLILDYINNIQGEINTDFITNHVNLNPTMYITIDHVDRYNVFINNIHLMDFLIDNYLKTTNSYVKSCIMNYFYNIQNASYIFNIKLLNNNISNFLVESKKKYILIPDDIIIISYIILKTIISNKSIENYVSIIKNTFTPLKKLNTIFSDGNKNEKYDLITSIYFTILFLFKK